MSINRFLSCIHHRLAFLSGMKVHLHGGFKSLAYHCGHRSCITNSVQYNIDALENR